MIKAMYCDVCEQEYKQYKRHLKTNKHTFNLLHLLTPIQKETKHCSVCYKNILKKGFKIHLKTNLHLSNFITTKNSDGAFKGHIKIRVFNFKPPEPESIVDAVEIVKPAVQTLIEKTLKEMKPLKFYMGVELEITKDEGVIDTPYMRTEPHFISSYQDFKTSGVYDELIKQEQDVHNSIVGSGFNIGKIIFIDIHILKSDPLKASSYIDLPSVIKNKKAVINIKNKDNKCFL